MDQKEEFGSNQIIRILHAHQKLHNLMSLIVFQESLDRPAAALRHWFIHLEFIPVTLEFVIVNAYRVNILEQGGDSLCELKDSWCILNGELFKEVTPDSSSSVGISYCGSKVKTHGIFNPGNDHVMQRSQWTKRGSKSEGLESLASIKLSLFFMFKALLIERAQRT